MTPRVYSKRKGAEKPPAGAVYVGRPSPFGNPFTHLPDIKNTVRVGSVVEAVERYRHAAIIRFREEPDWLAPLQGKDLVCWCHGPNETEPPCHADVLLELANREECQAVAG